MKEYTATELAYKNGYNDGYEAGVREFVKQLIDKSNKGFVSIDDILDSNSELSATMSQERMRGNEIV